MFKFKDRIKEFSKSAENLFTDFEASISEISQKIPQKKLTRSSPISPIRIARNCIRKECNSSSPSYDIIEPDEIQVDKNSINLLSRYSTQLKMFSTQIPESYRNTLSKDELKRQDRIAEFIFFERLHLRRLRIISAIFYETLRKHLAFIDIEEKIPAVETLISLHTKLVHLFESSFDFKIPDTETQNETHTQAIYNFGDVLQDWLKQGGTFKVFIEACKDFCKKQLSAGLWIQEQRDNISELNSDMVQAENNPLVCRLPFANYLAAQMQHLTKYPLLINDILKNTKKDSKEFKIITQVKERFEEIVRDVNDAVKKAENQQKHEEIAENLDIRTLKEFKEMKTLINLRPTNLIHYGVLNFNNNDYQCLLFENVFVMTTMRVTRQYILKPTNFMGQTIYPVMRICSDLKVIGNIATENRSESGSISSANDLNQGVESASIASVSSKQSDEVTVSDSVTVLGGIFTTNKSSRSQSHNAIAEFNRSSPLNNFEFIIKSGEPKQELRVKCTLPGQKQEWLVAFGKSLEQSGSLRKDASTSRSKNSSSSNNNSNNNQNHNNNNNHNNTTYVQYHNNKNTQYSNHVNHNYNQNVVNKSRYQEIPENLNINSVSISNSNSNDESGQSDTIAEQNKLGYSASVRSNATIGDYSNYQPTTDLGFDVDEIMNKYR